MTRTLGLGHILKRDLANKYLEKFYDQPLQKALKGLDKELDELRAVFTPEEISSLRNKFIRFKESRPVRFRATVPSKPAQSAGKYLKMKPEDISRMFDTRSGIKELKGDLGKTAKGRQIFDMLKRQKIRDILRQCNIAKKSSGKQLYELLNRRENFEILSELLGEKEVEAAREFAEEIKNKPILREFTRKVGTKALQHGLALKLLRTIWPLIP